LFFVPSTSGGQPEYFLRSTLLDIFGREKTGEVLANNLIGSISLYSFGTGIPTEDLALWVHHEDGIVLDSIEEHPISFFALSKGILRELAFALRLCEMRFRRLAGTDVADRRCHQYSFGAFQRT